MSTSEENKAIFRRWFEETWNKGNMQATEEATAANFVLHTPGPQIAAGLAGFKQFVSLWRSGFSDGQMTIEDLFAGGDKVVARWRAQGTHDGSFFGMPATGKPVSVNVST